MARKLAIITLSIIAAFSTPVAFIASMPSNAMADDTMEQVASNYR